ncbi:3-dehydroquinate synthase [Desulfotomaculum arcticum]|uniref:3-dehydroquinate synthase n=1 Tax=Desulfotruncus arcticus DSM 17038 TaxID=1121424 RepID=A0A1I2ZE72_9FIRM|nr:3-dehydroquinate synthase [Desulfotruncus arcticus]SFH36172.1 3-dehydroquinate synthase [Desulfotomaculum arcticum] [Desulfotruncus arcticus DSM 17038]
MKEVEINLGSRAYKIIIGGGELERAGGQVAGLFGGSKALLVTNPIVGALFAERVTASLKQAGIEAVVAEIPDGEEYKTLQSAEMLYDRAFSAGLDRHCPVLALGGGVVGDLAGFVAATYMRGVPFVQLPTTLLAQVDSSVGGKVAVNHPRGKNIIGAFYQPALVLTDPVTLHTLDNGEILSGLAEVIKYGIISDSAFFDWLEANIERVLALESDAIIHVIERSCLNKARVVEDDETEQGNRAILNLGHTVGHAIEAIAGYGRYRHGEAVSIGTAVAARLAVELGVLQASEEIRIKNLLLRTGLPVDVPKDLATVDMVRSMYGDKKNFGGQINYVLPTGIGKAVVYKNMPEERIKLALDSLRL